MEDSDKSSDELFIIHFNDAHNIQESEKENELVVGGAARFITAIQQ